MKVVERIRLGVVRPNSCHIFLVVPRAPSLLSKMRGEGHSALRKCEVPLTLTIESCIYFESIKRVKQISEGKNTHQWENRQRP